MIDRAKAEGIDAVIASDFAAILYARRIGVEVHISTQSNISNSEACLLYTSVPAAWPATLDSLLARFPDARIVVPGHGTPGGPELILSLIHICASHGAGPPRGREPRKHCTESA